MSRSKSIPKDRADLTQAGISQVVTHEFTVSSLPGRCAYMHTMREILPHPRYYVALPLPVALVTGKVETTR